MMCAHVLSWAFGWADWAYWARFIRVRVAQGSIKPLYIRRRDVSIESSKKQIKVNRRSLTLSLPCGAAAADRRGCPAALLGFRAIQIHVHEVL